MAGRDVKTHRDLQVYGLAFELSQSIFQVSKKFPTEERYSLTDQVRRSSRSVTASIAEGWRKRRYAAAFILKLNDAEAEAAETQSWIEHAVKCGYLDRGEAATLYRDYDRLLRMLVAMITQHDKWVFPDRPSDSKSR